MKRTLSLLVFLFIIASCSPSTDNSAIVTPIQSQTATSIQPLDTVIPSAIALPSIITTITPTIMVLPSATFPPVKILNAGPTQSQVEAAFAEAAIDFPKSLISIYEDDYYRFDFRLSARLVKNAKIREFHPPDELIESIAYEVLGRILYMQKNYDKDKYGAFDEIEQMDANGTFPQLGSHIYQDIAKEVMTSGPVDIDHPFSIQRFEGKLDSIQVSLVTKNEFTDLVNTLDNEGIKYAWRLAKGTEYYDENWDSDALVFMTKEGNLVIVSYNRGANNAERYDKYTPPTEFQSSSNPSFFLLHSIVNDLQNATFITQQLFGAKQGVNSLPSYPMISNVCPIPQPGQFAGGEEGICIAPADSSFVP